jgi:stage V sporulation protein R
MENSSFLNRPGKDNNEWMKTVMEVVRRTSIFFQPQIRTKIMNEGWASYWHEKLFLQDENIKGHEVDFALVNANVVSLPRVGLNPYALGKIIFESLDEELGDKGKYSFNYRLLSDEKARKDFDENTDNGKPLIFKVRRQYCDFTFVNSFIDQDLVNKHKLFVAGTRYDPYRRTVQHYVKSRRGENYRQMVVDQLYHPTSINFKIDDEGTLYLYHNFEGKPLVKDFIENTLMGIEYLWGAKVKLETSEVADKKPKETGYRRLVPFALSGLAPEDNQELEVTWKRVLWTMKDRKANKITLENSPVHKK